MAVRDLGRREWCLMGRVSVLQDEAEHPPCLVGSPDHQFPRLLGSRGSSKPWGQGVSARATQQDPVSKYYKVKRAAEMIQWLRALIAHGEEPGPFPSTYSHVGSQPSIASSRESHALS